MTAETMLELARTTREINDANGFQPTTYDRLPIVLCLIHSEISEAFIEWRLSPQEFGLELFGLELADICIRVFDLFTYDFVKAGWGDGWAETVLLEHQCLDPIHDLDLDYNLNFMHSRVSDSLERYRKGGDSFDGQVLSPLISLLAITFSIADELDLDLEGLIRTKLEKNRQRGYRHGGKRI